VLDGNADPEEIKAAGEHLKICPSCTQTSRLLRELDSEKCLNPFRQKLSDIVGYFRLSAPKLVLSVAGLLLLLGIGILWWNYSHPVKTQNQEVAFSIKGNKDTIDVAIQRGNVQFKAKRGDTFVQGDLLGFFYSASKPGYLALFHLDRSGNTSVLFPIGKSQSQKIEAGAEIPLPDGAVASAMKDYEWLVAVFSEDPLSLSSMDEILRRSAAHSSSDGAIQVSIPEARTLWIFPIR
jgi:hypothetical protein